MIILGWTLTWLAWNMFAPAGARFDPAPAFVLWLFISNLIQILLLPLVMIGQNLQGRHSELRAESDFEINQKSEVEIETVLQHLEIQATMLTRQGKMIAEVLRRLPEPVLPSTPCELQQSSAAGPCVPSPGGEDRSTSWGRAAPVAPNLHSRYDRSIRVTHFPQLPPRRDGKTALSG